MFAIRTIRLFAFAALLTGAAGCATDIRSSATEIKSSAAGGNSRENSNGSAANGKDLFVANACATCHAVTKGSDLTVGPNLVGVVGRQAGTTKSLMGPSENLKKYGVTWNAETLNEFLINPSAKVPGTAMIGMVADPQQRADVIAYLATLKE